MAKILTLFAGLVLLFCSCVNNLSGTLESHRQVNAGVYIHHISNNSFNDSAPEFQVKLVNDTSHTSRIELVCDLDYLIGPNEEQTIIVKLEPRQWRKIRFQGRRTGSRMTGTCDLGN
jgi:hypothetical protein